MENEFDIDMDLAEEILSDPDVIKAFEDDVEGSVDFVQWLQENNLIEKYINELGEDPDEFDINNVLTKIQGIKDEDSALEDALLGNEPVMDEESMKKEDPLDVEPEFEYDPAEEFKNVDTETFSVGKGYEEEPTTYKDSVEFYGKLVNESDLDKYASPEDKEFLLKEYSYWTRKKHKKKKESNPGTKKMAGVKLPKKKKPDVEQGSAKTKLKETTEFGNEDDYEEMRDHISDKVMENIDQLAAMKYKGRNSEKLRLYEELVDKVVDSSGNDEMVEWTDQLQVLRDDIYDWAISAMVKEPNGFLARQLLTGDEVQEWSSLMRLHGGFQ